MNNDQVPVRIEARLLSRIGIREWGLPSLSMPGQIWRSEDNGTVSCMVAHEDPTKVKIETRPLEILTDGFAASWMPDHWRAALWEYVQAWPSSGCGLGPFLALTERQRCDFIRKRAKELVNSDNIGCRHIAHDIGQFASDIGQLSRIVTLNDLSLTASKDGISMEAVAKTFRYLDDDEVAAQRKAAAKAPKGKK